MYSENDFFHDSRLKIFFNNNLEYNDQFDYFQIKNNNKLPIYREDNIDVRIDSLILHSFNSLEIYNINFIFIENESDNVYIVNI
jgi:hypothetical protein